MKKLAGSNLPGILITVSTNFRHAWESVWTPCKRERRQSELFRSKLLSIQDGRIDNTCMPSHLTHMRDQIIAGHTHPRCDYRKRSPTTSKRRIDWSMVRGGTQSPAKQHRLLLPFFPYPTDNKTVNRVISRSLWHSDNWTKGNSGLLYDTVYEYTCVPYSVSALQAQHSGP